MKVKNADPKLHEEVKAGKISVGEAASKLQAEPKETAGSDGEPVEKIETGDRREAVVSDAAAEVAQESVTEADRELARWFMGKLQTVDDYKKVLQLIRLSNPAGVVAALRELEPARRLGWNLIIDEIPQAYDCFDENVPVTHPLITEHVRHDPFGVAIILCFGVRIAAR